MNAKKITFVLNGCFGIVPVGGYKVVYEYANRLSQKGWSVTVIHPMALERPESFLGSVRRYGKYVLTKISRRYLPAAWFTINKDVSMRLVPDLSEKRIPDADYIVACPVEVVADVNSYSEKKGRKYYFIQGFETWGHTREKVVRSWKLPLQKIVVSKWLQGLVNAAGENAVCIPNGLNFSAYYKTMDFSTRVFRSILFLTNIAECKGTVYAFQAAAELKKKFPDLIVRTFGLYPRPAEYPSYIEYYKNPPQEKIRDLYNSSAVFIAPSLSEGWGLTPCEAMLCGCVVIATDIGGHREFLVDGRNGFFCEKGSAASIVEKAEFIFSNHALSEKISQRAPETLEIFGWDRSVELFEAALLNRSE